MKSKLLFSILLSWIFMVGHGQVAYYDAIKLNSFINPQTGLFYTWAEDSDKVKKLCDILKLYVPGGTGITSVPTILNFYRTPAGNTNPFIGPLLDAGGQAGFDAATIATGGPAAFSSFANADISNFAEGVAQFLADRFKEEISASFFEKMKQQFGYFPELRVMFPQTYQLISNIDSYSYGNLVQALKEAFEGDMQSLYLNAYGLTNLDPSACTGASGKEFDACTYRMNKMHNFFQRLPGQWVSVGLYTMQSAKSGVTPAEIINNMATSTPFKQILDSDQVNQKISFNTANAILLTNLISQSFIQSDGSQVWVSTQDIAKLFQGTDMVPLRIYLGLLYQQMLLGGNHVQFYKADNNKILFTDILADGAGDAQKLTALLNNFRSFLQQTGLQFSTVNAALTGIKKANTNAKDIDPATILNYYKASSTLIRNVLASPLLVNAIPDIRNKTDEALNIIDPAVSVVYDIYSKKYSSVFWDAMSVFTNVEIADKDGLFGHTSPGFLKSDASQALMKYGTFISTVATAKTPAEVKAAIESAALPVGSAAIKKRSSWSFAVNAYVGGFYGISHTKYDSIAPDSSKHTVHKRAATFGLYAPIGITFSKGIRCKNNNNSSISIFAQIVDLGALVNFYLKNGDTATMPSNVKIRFIDIFAPGIQAAYGFPRVPVSLMGGVQFVPVMSQISDLTNTNQTLNSFGWRAHISLVVDIPMFNLKTIDFKKL